MRKFLIRIAENLTFFDRVVAAVISFFTFIYLDILLPNENFSDLIILIALLHMTMPFATWGAPSTLLGVISLLSPEKKRRVFFANLAGVSVTSIFSCFVNVAIFSLALPIDVSLGLPFFVIGYFNSWVICELFLYNRGRVIFVLRLRVFLFLIFTLFRYFLYAQDYFEFLILSVPLEAAIRNLILVSVSSPSLKSFDRRETIKFLKNNLWTAISNTLSGGTYRSIIPLAGAMHFHDMVSLGYAQRFFDFFALLFTAAVQNIAVRLSKISGHVLFVELLQRLMILLSAVMVLTILSVSFCLYAIELYWQSNYFDTLLLCFGVFAGGVSASIGILGYLSARVGVERARAEVAIVSAGVMYLVVISGIAYWSPIVVYASLPLVSLLLFAILPRLVPRFADLRKVHSLFLLQYKRSH